MGEPSRSDDEGASEKENELGELEELVVDGSEGERYEDSEEVEDGGDDGLHRKSITEQSISLSRTIANAKPVIFSCWKIYLDSRAVALRSVLPLATCETDYLILLDVL